MSKKIKFYCSWDSSENIASRVLAHFLTSKEDIKDIEIVYDDSYDVGICFNHAGHYPPIDPNKPYLIFPQEPCWHGCHQKNLHKNVIMFGFDKNLYTGEGKCIESIMYALYGGIGHPHDSINVWNYNYLTSTNFIKTKNLSSSITPKFEDKGINCIYPKRARLLYSLINEPYIDLYGCETLSNGAPTINAQGCNIKMGFYNKIDIVAPYKFTLTVENTHSKNYITEKFYDAILTDCIPIYYGVNNLKEYYPENGYFLIEDINDTDSIKNLLKTINNNADDIYKEKIIEAKKIKQKYFSHYNLLKKIVETCKSL